MTADYQELDVVFKERILETQFLLIYKYHNVFSGSPSNLDMWNFGAHAVSARYKKILKKFGGYLYHADTAWAPKFRTFRSEGDPNMLRQCTLWILK